MTKILKCILVPRTKEFFVAETNKQAAKIGAEKINEIFDLMPLLKEEIDFSRGSKTTFKDDYIRLTFKNGSILDLVSQGDAQRGGRRHGGIFEEVLMLDGEQLSSVVIPLMNISRRTALGEFNEKEPRRQSNYITSAGYKSSFAYQKCIETLLKSVIYPDKYFCWGGDYKIPVFYGLMEKETIKDAKLSPTFSADIFAREYCSKWTGTIEGALFNLDKLTALRKLKRPEFKPNTNGNPKVFYVLSVDVGRKRDKSAFEIFKVIPKEDHFEKHLVNILIFHKMSLQAQARKIREMDETFNFEIIAVDANGLILIVPYISNSISKSL